MFHGGFHRGAWSCDVLFGDANVQPVEKLRRFGVRHPGEELFEQRDKFLLLSGSAGLPMLPQGPLSYRRNVQDGVRLLCGGAVGGLIGGCQAAIVRWLDTADGLHQALHELRRTFRLSGRLHTACAPEQHKGEDTAENSPSTPHTNILTLLTSL